MKAVDPAVKIGAVLTMPGNWPDGIIGAGDAADWNHTVLAAVAHDVDFVSVHWYPGAADGTHVHVTDNGSNRTLAPRGGATVSFGFVGANDRANPSPTVFRLNGTVCSTIS